MTDENDKMIPEVTAEPIIEGQQTVTGEAVPVITSTTGQEETQKMPDDTTKPQDTHPGTDHHTDEPKQLSKAEKERLLKEEERRKEEEEEAKVLKAAIAEQAREDEQPQSSSFTLRKILGGDILSAQLLRNNIWLIIVIVGFIIVYISNRYSVQKDLLEIDKLNTELEDAKYRALSSSSQLTEKSRESHILEQLKNRKDSVLKMSDRPPYIINVPEK